MPKKKKEQPRKMQIRHSYDPDYKLVYANGVFGGITPKGELLMDFTIYRQADVKLETFLVDSKNKTRQRIEDETEAAPPTLIRKVGVIVPSNEIDTIAKWMRTMSKELSKLNKADKDVS